MSEHAFGKQKELESSEHPTASLIEAYLSTHEPAETDEQMKKHLAECEQCKQAASAIQKRIWGDVANELKGF